MRLTRKIHDDGPGARTSVVVYVLLFAIFEIYERCTLNSESLGALWGPPRAGDLSLYAVASLVNALFAAWVLVACFAGLPAELRADRKQFLADLFALALLIGVQLCLNGWRELAMRG